MDPPTTSAAGTPFRVLTLNCWGLLGVSRHRTARFEAIGRALATCGADAVCLQEVWVAGDAARLATLAAGGGRLVHAHHFRCGAFGAGLVTLSAHPILSARFTRFAAAGDPLALHQGDAVAGKGVGCVRLGLPGGTCVDVFNTHLSAAYSDAHGRRAEAAGRGGGKAPAVADTPFIPPRDFNGGVRLAQVVQLADFVRGCCAAQVSGSGCSLFFMRG
jgi:endonuclease/exonuclease/phosphatase family metal-dependent hydrolase